LLSIKKLLCDVFSKLLLQASAVFTFANQAGLDMLETTLLALQDIMLDKVLDEEGRKILLSEFSKIMQQVRLTCVLGFSLICQSTCLPVLSLVIIKNI